MYSKIAVATDGTETAAKAVEVAVDLAAKYGAELLVFTAFEHHARQPLAEDKDHPEDHQWVRSTHEDVESVMERAAEQAKASGIEARTVAREGDPAHVIVDLAEEFHADLLVIGNKGMERRVLGSVPNSIAHHTPCSIVIAKTV
jgi:nucleotide-binding universal stress UspA family protein